MEVCAFRFSPKELRKIHQDHLGFLIASSHFCNEFVCLAPYIIFEQDPAKANEVEKAFITLRHMAILRQMASKIVEYHKLVHDYISKIRKTFPHEARRVQTAYKPISREIGSANWAKEIRNKASFHFDADYALERLKETADDTELNFMAGQFQGVTYYNFAEEVISYPWFERIGDGDPVRGSEKVYNFCWELHSKIPKFHADLVIHHFSRAGLLGKQDRLELRREYCAEAGTLKIPIAVLVQEPT